MTTITIAQGERYIRLADHQTRRMEKHEWTAGRIVVKKEKAGKDRARDEKTGFARHLPDNAPGPVLLMDADCLVRGPQPELNFDADVAGVLLRNGWKGLEKCPKPDCGYLDSMFLWFRDVPTAKALSETWFALWAEGVGRESAWTDTFSLQYALQDFRAIAIPKATGTRPCKSVLHCYINAGFNKQ